MKKKFLLSILFSFVLVLFSTVCFAANNDKNNTMTKQIGNEITSSIKETEKSVDNLINTDVLDENRTTNNKTTNNETSNNLRNMGNDIGKDVKDGTEEVRNRVVAGTTGNYMAGETANGTGMSTTTWIWIILAVIAVIIIAAVWYYASQRND